MKALDIYEVGLFIHRELLSQQPGFSLYVIKTQAQLDAQWAEAISRAKAKYKESDWYSEVDWEE